MFDTVIFLGPSLDRAVARTIVDAEYLPPIKRGNLSSLSDGVKSVGIIDGEFYQNLAVSPKEIIRLLGRGVKVFGSSSMGALRAAETYTYGMTGVGAIFEMYRDGVIDADDEVALTYDPESYRSTSEPLVNIRFALKSAVLEGIIDRCKADEVLRQMKELYFPFRSYRSVIRLCPELKDFLALRCPDQKKDDALLLLDAIRKETE